MAFGSYDESEQEQPKKNDDDNSEGVTDEIKGENSEYDGKETVEKKNLKDMMKHL
jgi:hypothetical protein